MIAMAVGAMAVVLVLLVLRWCYRTRMQSKGGASARASTVGKTKTLTYGGFDDLGAVSSQDHLVDLGVVSGAGKPAPPSSVPPPPPPGAPPDPKLEKEKVLQGVELFLHGETI